MKLAQLLEGVQVTKLFQTMYGQMVVTQDVTIANVQYDSRKVGVNDCFVALRGVNSDGHRFVQNAITQGARVIIVEDESVLPDALCMHAGIIKVVVPDTKRTLAQIAANFYGHPADQLTIVGVTGTNGKTTTSNLVRAILEKSGKPCGLIGTIEYRIGTMVYPSTHTTPESLELQQMFSEMVKAGCAAVSMEVSSHALDQRRVEGIHFAGAIFSNLTQDHLDYHGTMENYFIAKKKLFDNLSSSAVAVVNRDDAYGERIIADCRARKVFYSLQRDADVVGTIVELSLEGTTIEIKAGKEQFLVRTPLIGRFNAYNVVSAVSVALALGIRVEDIQAGIEAMKSVRGRFESLRSKKGWMAVIDYAHTPDALEKCLRTIREVMPSNERGRIITVFGAGGDRDKTKRPLMGKVAGLLSDMVIVTSDNPRSENPEAIIDDICRGIPPKTNVCREVDRRKAIETAVKIAQKGDIVLIAGKGHEDYQIIGTERRHFSDKEVVESLL
ncbi:MAG: UDP-N-acetylmuramoyl-L-alanyl-D-glutamate--2,6-diaminopimelate ligase [Bacteroidetes bacterium]|nr:UDP-N-acetylmuramoyl-L-alanyl-D-glutamate--2,6-diaminopimelate ligase [Bacteroidota bacterium]